MNNNDHKDNAEDVNEEQIDRNANDAEDTDGQEYNNKNNDKSLDNWGKVVLTMVFQNPDNNQTEYVYTRDSNGRVHAADCCLNVHQNKVNLLLHNENGSIIDVECCSEKMGQEDNTNCS